MSGDLDPSPDDVWYEPELDPETIQRTPALTRRVDQMDALAKPVRASYTSLKLMKGNGTAYRMNDAAKDRACAAYARSGLLYIAAAAAGVTLETIRQHRKTDDLFEEAMEEARQEFCAALEMEAHRRAFEGVDEPVVGRIGKDEDGVITYVKRYSDRLTEMLLKRHMPEQFVERMQVDAQVTGGVLVVGGSMTLLEWEGAFGGRRPQPTLPILEHYRNELGLAPSNLPMVDEEGLVNVTPAREAP